jgi:membrane associated rhomboid family serine protease
LFPLKDNVPTRTTPVITIGLIAANSLAWFWEISNGVDKEVTNWGYYACEVQGPCAAGVHPHELVETLFSSMFLHASWFHILGNMLFLWIFGNNVEDAMGRVRFLLWYLAGGIAATALQTVATLQFGTLQDASVPNIGASGAIAAVLGAYFVLLPKARVLTAIFLGFFFFLYEVPAVFFLGLWILLQALEGGINILSPQSGGGVAFFAHIGGFAFGFATVRLFAKRRPLQPRW